MRFTKEKYPLLYKGFECSPLSNDYDLLNSTYKLIHSGKVNVYFLSKSFIVDACDNFDKIKNEQLTPGYYVLIHDAVFMVIVVLRWNNVKDNELKIASFSGSAITSLMDIVNGKYTFRHLHKNVYTESNAEQWTEGINTFIASLSFIHHADIKQKQCPPKGKLELFHCKYKSDIDVKVNICDESWYTECLQNHKFTVRSHLRWQPCGIMRMERKLTRVGCN